MEGMGYFGEVLFVFRIGSVHMPHNTNPPHFYQACCMPDKMLAEVSTENSLWMKVLGGLENPKDVRKIGTDQQSLL